MYYHPRRLLLLLAPAIVCLPATAGQLCYDRLWRPLCDMTLPENSSYVIHEPPLTEEQKQELAERRLGTEAGRLLSEALLVRKCAMEAHDLGHTEDETKLLNECIELLNQIIEDYPGSREAVSAERTLRQRVYGDMRWRSRFRRPPRG